MTTVPVADDSLDAFLDDLFLGCAFAAYVEQARHERQSPPDSEATRERAYRYYEEALAEKNAKKPPAITLPPGPPAPRPLPAPAAWAAPNPSLRGG